MIPLKDINLGFTVPNIIAKLRRNDTVMLAKVKEYIFGALKFIIGMITKLFERSPLGLNFLRYASIFDLFELERHLLTKRTKSLLKFVIELNIMEPSLCDKALSEFNSFCDDDHKTISDKFAEFEESSCCLDEFFFEKIGIQKVIICHQTYILTLSHGQASAERCFSINNAILETNMLLETIVSKQIVRDHVTAKGLQPHTIKIDKPIMFS